MKNNKALNSEDELGLKKDRALLENTRENCHLKLLRNVMRRSQKMFPLLVMPPQHECVMATCKIKKIPEDDEVGRIVREEFVDKFCDEFVLVGDEETSMPRYYESFAESIRNFEVHDSDVMVCSFPKAGTTWTQEMVWLIANNLDYEGAKVNLGERFPFLEICSLYDFDAISDALGVKGPEYSRNSPQFAQQQKNPRFIKTHLPFSLLPEAIQNGHKSPKMIYVMRNPKDVCVSYYHHGKLLQGWRANLENFSKVFMTNMIMYGSFWKHVFGYWERRNLSNMLIITYEDMKKDLATVIKGVANFLGKDLTDEQMKPLLKHLSFESMKKNKAVNVEDYLNIRKQKNLLLEDGQFIRSGTVGKYKEEMSPEIIEKFNTWIKENISGTSFGETYNYNF